jgi:hypothetical protein
MEKQLSKTFEFTIKGKFIYEPKTIQKVVNGELEVKNEEDLYRSEQDILELIKDKLSDFCVNYSGYTAIEKIEVLEK